MLIENSQDNSWTLQTQKTQYKISRENINIKVDTTPYGYECYRATSAENKEVVIKRYKKANEEQFYFGRENAVSQAMNSNSKLKNIDLQIDFANVGDYYYLIFPYWKETLLTSINKGMIKTELEAIEYFRQICNGIRELHFQNIAHRMLQTTSIKCRELNANEIKGYGYPYYLLISDFQKSKNIENKMGNSKIGMRQTIAPEVNSHNYGVDIDSFSMGCILYNMIFKMYPFIDEKVDRETIEQIPLLSKVSETTARILEGCLQIKSKNRMKDEELYSILKLNVLYEPFEAMRLGDIDQNESICLMQRKRDNCIINTLTNKINLGKQNALKELSQLKSIICKIDQSIPNANLLYNYLEKIKSISNIIAKIKSSSNSNLTLKINELNETFGVMENNDNSVKSLRNEIILQYNKIMPKPYQEPSDNINKIPYKYNHISTNTSINISTQHHKCQIVQTFAMYSQGNSALLSEQNNKIVILEQKTDILSQQIIVENKQHQESIQSIIHSTEAQLNEIKNKNEENIKDFTSATAKLKEDVIIAQKNAASLNQTNSNYCESLKLLEKGKKELLIQYNNKCDDMAYLKIELEKLNKKYTSTINFKIRNEQRLERQLKSCQNEIEERDQKILSLNDAISSIKRFTQIELKNKDTFISSLEIQLKSSSNKIDSIASKLMLFKTKFQSITKFISYLETKLSNCYECNIQCSKAINKIVNVINCEILKIGQQKNKVHSAFPFFISIPSFKKPIQNIKQQIYNLSQNFNSYLNRNSRKFNSSTQSPFGNTRVSPLIAYKAFAPQARKENKKFRVLPQNVKTLLTIKRPASLPKTNKYTL